MQLACQCMNVEFCHISALPAILLCKYCIFKIDFDTTLCFHILNNKNVHQHHNYPLAKT